MYGIGNKYQFISLSNCYVVESPLDAYGSIMEADENLVQISKRRGGVGIDISHLRPSGAPTKMLQEQVLVLYRLLKGTQIQ